MNKTLKIIKYELVDVLRNKWLIFYALFFLIVTDGLFRFGGGGGKVIISFINIMLFIIPLVSLIFGTIYVYNAREFIELLLSQTVNRRMLFRGMYFGLALPLVLGFVAGVGAPFLLHDRGAHGEMLGLLLSAGALLTLIFVALAFLIAVKFEDRARGLGVTIMLWLVFAVLYDGAVLMASFVFADYPLEKPMLAISLLNPIDLARILLLLKSDFSALMGYTGAVFRAFFGSGLGLGITSVALLVWMAAPYHLGARAFAKKDF